MSKLNLLHRVTNSRILTAELSKCLDVYNNQAVPLMSISGGQSPGGAGGEITVFTDSHTVHSE